ncbi:hypothetical protein LPJ78_002886 [Coemansia sp. RSA 989]|nr:hypothetical protein LPJ68_002109 [Coemansia sp. RSA 1086]KAJ1865191.1 hypothetical protein LPJ78_002886 [Coemansia sp. RSA 989]KAJ2677256.1 hypothetical protein IWW42_000062 [Coemansia sp. RSA 1085]
MARNATLLVLDFDQTLTSSDTLNMVAAVAKRKYPENRDFAWFTEKYMEDYRKHQAQWQSRIDNEKTTREFLNEYLESFRSVETASLNRISKYGILAGVSRDELYDGGRVVEFQPGAATAIHRFMQAPNTHVCVVSVNWSADFIRGALDANGVLNSKSILVACNNPEFDKHTGLSQADISPRLVVASDKIATINNYKQEIAQKTGLNPRLVYAGDSLTDLPALLLADTGLLVGQSNSVIKWCKMLGVAFDQPRSAEGGKTLHCLPSWESALEMI